MELVTSYDNADDGNFSILRAKYGWSYDNADIMNISQFGEQNMVRFATSLIGKLL